jgi:hypothetical protein
MTSLSSRLPMRFDLTRPPATIALTCDSRSRRRALSRRRCSRRVVFNRYYDPSTEQFLSIDPDVAETGQPYTYIGDDPLDGTDPLGLCNGPDGICRNQATGQMNMNSSNDASDWAPRASSRVNTAHYTPPTPPKYQYSALDEFLTWLTAEPHSVTTYFERRQSAARIPRPASANTGSATPVPSQVMANQTYQREVNSTLQGSLCYVGVTAGAAGGAAGIERLSAGLGRPGVESDEAKPAFSNPGPPGWTQQLQQEGDGLDTTGEDDAGPTDGGSALLVALGSTMMGVGGLFSYVLASHC